MWCIIGGRARLGMLGIARERLACVGSSSTTGELLHDILGKESSGWLCICLQITK